MNKELQDLAWSILPKEFKEEVKKLYTEFYNEKPHSDCSYGYLGLLIKLFGIHNLTSDAEGEEMLCVKAKIVQEMYAANDRLIADHAGDEIEHDSATINDMLRNLFGSKCLPDGAESPILSKVEKIGKDCKAEPKFNGGDIAVVRGFKHPLLKQDGAIVTILSYHDKGDFYSVALSPNIGIDVDAKYLEPYTGPLSQNQTENCDNEKTISKSEPKFKVGDKVNFKCSDGDVIQTIHSCRYDEIINVWFYNFSEGGPFFNDAFFEPYTEPKPTCTETCTNVCPSPRPSQEESNRGLCDKLIQRGFKNHNRLHVASIIMAGLLASGKDKHSVKRALELADTLISEAEKGGKQC